MEKIVTVEQGLNKLLGKLEIAVPRYKIVRGGRDDFCDTLEWSGKRIPVLWWRFHEKYGAMKNFLAGENPGTVCGINVYSFTTVEESLTRLLYRELDIAEWLLGSQTKKVTAFRTGDAMNAIAVMHNGTVANLELGATMPQGAMPQCQHRVLTTSGMTSDRAVDTVTVQSAVYVFAGDPKPDVYTDLESWLYGLSPDDTDAVMFLLAVMRGEADGDGFAAADAHLKAAVKAACDSADQERTCEVEEKL